MCCASINYLLGDIFLVVAHNLGFIQVLAIAEQRSDVHRTTILEVRNYALRRVSLRCVWSSQAYWRPAWDVLAVDG